MGLMVSDKTRCGGQWTEARFKSFIKGQLRAATVKWPPIQNVVKQSVTRRGFKMCACCDQEVPVTIVVDGKRMKNTFCDHISPIVPVTGWVSWDDCIERMFCEEENLQILCKACHDDKSAGEAKQRAEFRRSNDQES